MHSLALLVCAVFVLLALWHVRMAFGDEGLSAAMPSVAGKPLFVPSRGATLAVAGVLVSFAALVAFLHPS